MLAERPGEPQMEASPLAGQQVCIDRFSKERVAKRIARAGGIVGEQVALDGIAQRAV